CESYQAGWIFASHALKGRERLRMLRINNVLSRPDDGVQRPEVGEQTNRPDANVFVLFREQSVEHRRSCFALLILFPQLRQPAGAHQASRLEPRLRWPRIAVADLEHAPARAMHAGVFVAFADVAPVEDERIAIRPGADLEAAKVGVNRLEQVRLMTAYITTTQPLQPIHVRSPPMLVEREELPAIRLGPRLALVDHHADVRVSAAIRIRGQLLRP